MVWDNNATRPGVLQPVRQANRRASDGDAAAHGARCRKSSLARDFLVAISAFTQFSACSIYYRQHAARSRGIAGAPSFLRPLLSVVAIIILRWIGTGISAGWGLMHREPWARPSCWCWLSFAVHQIPWNGSGRLHDVGTDARRIVSRNTKPWSRSRREALVEEDLSLPPRPYRGFSTSAYAARSGDPGLRILLLIRLHQYPHRVDPSSSHRILMNSTRKAKPARGARPWFACIKPIQRENSIMPPRHDSDERHKHS